jgi:ParB-like chromosome segregation protein Spo0J
MPRTHAKEAGAPHAGPPDGQLQVVDIGAPPSGAPSDMPQWPADHVERWPIERLIPYARNARTHKPAQIAQIAAAIREWGWTMPVLVDEEGELIAGHARVLAARQLHIGHVPTLVARGWSPAQKRAYRLADNKLTLNASWDDELLAGEIEDLDAENYDRTLLGFSDRELKRMFDQPATGDATVAALAETWAIVIECESEDQQQALIARFVAEGLTVRAG